MSTPLRCDGCGAWFGYGTEHRCSPVQFTTATNAVGMSPPPSPPTPTPPEGWEERTEWEIAAEDHAALLRLRPLLQSARTCVEWCANMVAADEQVQRQQARLVEQIDAALAATEHIR